MKKDSIVMKMVVFLLVFLMVFVLPPAGVEAVAPTVTTNPATGVESTNATLQGTIVNDGNVSILYEYYTASANNGLFIATTYWGSQMFTLGTVGANVAHSIKSVSLYVTRGGAGTPGVVTVSIRNTSGGKPTGADLAVGTTNGNLISNAIYEWVTINLSAYTLSVGTQYAIVVRCAGDSIRWDKRTGNNYLGGGTWGSLNSGASWTHDLGSTDFSFKEYGRGCNVTFNYGTTATYGNTSSVQRKVSGDTVSYDLTPLSPGQLYHFRVNATNINGTTNGADATFLTQPLAPTGIITKPYGSAINLTWTPGTGYNRTVIRANDSSYPLTPTSGALIYNGTGTVFNSTGLLMTHTYFYSIWSFTTWGGLSAFSTVAHTYDTTVYNTSSAFLINYPEYLEVGDYLHAIGTITNITSVPITTTWVYTNITNLTGTVITSTRFYLMNGYYNYLYSTSAMIPGIYFIHANCSHGGINYNTTRVLYLSQPGGLGHARAMCYFSFYNTNEGLGLPLETLKIYINDTRIFQNTFESYTGEKINLKVKDYYNTTLYQNNFTIQNTTEFYDLGLTFHSYLFGNLNTQYYIISFLKQGASRWFERGIVPNGQTEFLLPSGNYTMRIYNATYVNLYAGSVTVNRSMVYVISGTNLSVVIAGQSVITGQLLELRTELQDALRPSIVRVLSSPPGVWCKYQTEGSLIGTILICPVLAVTATTRNASYVNGTSTILHPLVPRTTSANGTIYTKLDSLYLSNVWNVSWVNITVNATSTNYSYVPTKINLFGENVTIHTHGNLTFLRETTYQSQKKFYWTKYTLTNHYTATNIINNSLNTTLYDLYVIIQFANDTTPDYYTTRVYDVTNGLYLTAGENFMATATGIDFSLTSIGASLNRTFTCSYDAVDVVSQTDNAIVTINDYLMTEYNGRNYYYADAQWMNRGSATFIGALNIGFNFSTYPYTIAQNSIIVYDDTNSVLLTRDQFAYFGSGVTILQSVMGQVEPNHARTFRIYWLQEEEPENITTASIIDFFFASTGITGLPVIGDLLWGWLIIAILSLFIVIGTYYLTQIQTKKKRILYIPIVFIAGIFDLLFLLIMTRGIL